MSMTMTYQAMIRQNPQTTSIRDLKTTQEATLPLSRITGDVTTFGSTSLALLPLVEITTPCIPFLTCCLGYGVGDCSVSETANCCSISKKRTMT